jgi:hypothetical protein
MEQWKASTDEQYKKNLCEAVRTITEDLFSQASYGYSNPPKKYVDAHPISGGRSDAVEITFRSDKYKFRQIVFWHDFVTVMESLCYKVSKNSTFEYIITPNPSC